MLINKIKYKTLYIKQQTRIVFKTDNLADYLFLNSDTQQECYTVALLEFTIVILLAAFLWRFNFNYPFKTDYLNHIKLIFGLIIIDIMLKWLADMHTSSWVNGHLNSHDIKSERYSYPSMGSNYTAFFIVAISVMLYLYNKAVTNQEKVDLMV